MSKASWHVNILTLFPEMFPGSLGASLSGKALDKGLWSYRAVNMRDFGLGVHKSVDDTPFGGGAGMVLRADVLEEALLSLPEQAPKNIYMSPRGKPLTQQKVVELSQAPEITLLCGRYEGVDQRFIEAHNFEEVSIGDYVLSGGEPAAIILMDACIRLLDGVMGNTETPDEESFSNGLLEYPHYTKPASWTDQSGATHEVPDILTSGHHKNIEDWRKERSEDLTKEVRPDLWEKYKNT